MNAAPLALTDTRGDAGFAIVPEHRRQTRTLGN